MERYRFNVDEVVSYVLKKHGPACGIGLQFPEGLVAYGSELADRIQERLPDAFVIIFGDVLYGACNVDDCGCSQLGLDLLVHFGHSQAVRRPLLVDVCYVPVERVDFDPQEAGRVILKGLAADREETKERGGHGEAGDQSDRERVECAGGAKDDSSASKQNSTDHLDRSDPPGLSAIPVSSDAPIRPTAPPRPETIALVTTAQYCSKLNETKRYIEAHSHLRVHTPRFSPLNDYELLGCTCGRFPPEVSAVVSVADGEFHLEAAAIANPGLPVYRLDPNLMALEKSSYQAEARVEYRRRAVADAIELTKEAVCGRGKTPVGIVFGTMGRQGSEAVLRALRRALDELSVPYLVVGLSEVLPQLLFPFQAAYWVQLACPRLSFDWGEDYREANLLVLNAFEAFEVLRALRVSRASRHAEARGSSSGADTAFNIRDIEDAGLCEQGGCLQGAASPEPFPCGYSLHNFLGGTGEVFTYESLAGSAAPVR